MIATLPRKLLIRNVKARQSVLAIDSLFSDF
jgi:hypothetical protein